MVPNPKTAGTETGFQSNGQRLHAARFQNSFVSGISNSEPKPIQVQDLPI